MGACTYYGMSNLRPIANDVLDVGQTERDSNNRYVKIPDYDKENFIIETENGLFQQKLDV